MQMTNQRVVKVRRELIAACMTCPLCNNLLRDATTISECLHTFCRKCIYKKISDEEMECCPICNIELGCVPLEKLRPDHNLQDVRAKIFPYKRRKVEAPEVPSSVTLPLRRKERSLSSLVVSASSRVSQATTTGRRSKPLTRKAARESSFSIEKPIKREEDIVEDHPASSTSREKSKKFNQNIRQHSSSVEPSQPASNEETENAAERRDGKSDLWQPLNFLVEVASRTKSLKSNSQVSDTKLETMHVPETESQPGKTKSKGNKDKLKQEDDNNNANITTSELVEPKRLRRIRRKKAAAFRGSSVSSQTVADAASGKQVRRVGPVWFSLVASEDHKGDSPLPQIPSSYLRINRTRNNWILIASMDEMLPSKKGYGCVVVDFAENPPRKFAVENGHIPVSFIQKYLMKKLDLASEAEVEIKCMGQPVVPTLMVCTLVDQWLQKTSTSERVTASVGSSAKDFVMVLEYARKVPAL